MGRQKNKENMRMVRVAVTSDSGGQILSEKGGVQPCRQPFSEGMLSFQQEVDKSIALALEKNKAFSCQLTSYQGMAGVMNSKKVFDIVVLYVGKEEADSLKTEEMHWLKNTSARVICVANGTSFLKDAFLIGVFRYVLREDIEKDLPEAIEEVLQEIKPVRGLRLTINGEAKWVPFEDIYYIEAFGDEAIIYKKDTYSTVRKTMNYLLEQLGDAFYRCHKSYIVNFDYVQRIDTDSIILKDARSVPVSVRRRGGLLKIYNHYEESMEKNR